MESFKMPTAIYFGQQALEQLTAMTLGTVLIICDPFMKTSGMVKQVTERLEATKTDYALFSEIIPDPTIEVVSQGVAVTLAVQPQTIIALGGGSAMDAAKAIRKIYQTTLSQPATVKLICIPTTSGTGSEVTAFSVITDKQTQAKYALVSDDMVPDIAILDPTLTSSVPATITADTGLDVLTHCFEAFASTHASDFTDACAEKGMKMVWEQLVPVVKHGDNAYAREKMHNASCLAGIAFSEASLGICHSLAHALGGRFHMPHGRVNAMLLPHVISYNAGLDLAEETPALKRYEALAHVLGIKCGTPKATVRGLISSLNRQLNQLEIPKTIEEYGLDTTEYRTAVSDMAENALADKCTLTNPRQPSLEDLKGIYLKLSKGGR
ncbi:alcohol dehydrogenase [Vagococcus penaei]|uniref:Alcohol dehydrogenase n=1 Tax=Vagococcus penaei TaxID=633807 RepID=A0A1Q2D5Z9_9ENTE|nr:1-propanol dehydrogenase PduQ [Vagococcus penaei]AQP53763.1 alcohol dehydrogenase [Vagococcus penaei]RSU00406.1 alcohol dehydrogenase [Vagococcus penaei]